MFHDSKISGKENLSVLIKMEAHKYPRNLVN